MAVEECRHEKARFASVGADVPGRGLCRGRCAQAAPPKQPAGPQETPSQFYSRYRSAIQNAKSLDEVTKFWQRSLAAEFKQAPPDQRVDLAGLQRLYGKYRT